MKTSAGILLYRWNINVLQLFLVHPGGPFWQNKDMGSWSIPKGEFSDDEEPLAAAIREFKEETGFTIEGDFISLGSIKLKSGKMVHAWALQKDVDAGAINSNTFEIEWPPRSGKSKSFPEIDRAGWFTQKEALLKINVAQGVLVTKLIGILEKQNQPQ